MYVLCGVWLCVVCGYVVCVWCVVMWCVCGVCVVVCVVCGCVWCVVVQWHPAPSLDLPAASAVSEVHNHVLWRFVAVQCGVRASLWSLYQHRHIRCTGQFEPHIIVLLYTTDQDVQMEMSCELKVSVLWSSPRTPIPSALTHCCGLLQVNCLDCC